MYTQCYRLHLKWPHFKGLVPNMALLKGIRNLKRQTPREVFPAIRRMPLKRIVRPIFLPAPCNFACLYALPTGSKAAGTTKQGLSPWIKINLSVRADCFSCFVMVIESRLYTELHTTTNTQCLWNECLWKPPNWVRSRVMVTALCNCSYLFWYCDITNGGSAVWLIQ